MNLNLSLSGILNAIRRQEVTANNVANVNTPGYRARSAVGSTPQTEDSVDFSLEAQASNVNLAKEQTDTVVNRAALQANAAAFRVADKAVGDILDLKE